MVAPEHPAPPLRFPVRLPHTAWVKDRVHLEQILRPGMNLCVWERDLPPRLQTYLRLLTRGALLDVDQVVPRALPSLAPLLPELEGRWAEAFVQDLNQNLRIFTAFSEAKEVRVQLHTVDTDQCRLFHVDHLGLRLICTYVGPGTEWVANRDAIRPALGHCDLGLNNPRVVADPKKVQRLPETAVALMKGERYPGNLGNGLIHRSPPLLEKGLRRLRLIMDAKA